MTDYEELYRLEANVCGSEPFADVAAFFVALPAEPPVTILDVGCGQGRDALFAARLGHRVHGVDLSHSGVIQTASQAADAGLRVTAEVADASTYPFSDAFDVVLCDRVLHCLDASVRLAVLERMASCVVPSWYLFVVEPPSGEELVASHLGSSARWHRHHLRPGFVLAQATGPVRQRVDSGG